MDFDLNQLTEIYIQELAPVVWSYVQNCSVPAYMVYQETIKILDQIKEKADKSNNPKDKNKEFYEAVMGKDVVITTPQAYNELDMLLEMGGPSAVRDWKTMDIHQKARIKAQRMLKGMIDVVERYRRENDASIKRQMK